MTETPTAAFVLSLLGGIFVVIGGFALIGIGMLVGAIGSLGGISALSPLTGGLGNLSSLAGSSSAGQLPLMALGGVGVLLGIVTMLAAVLMHARPGRHRLWGSMVIGFSVVSWVTSLGGLLIGFLLALVGGVLAVAWRPSVVAQGPAQVARVCPACGTVLQEAMKFCPNCGRAFL